MPELTETELRSDPLAEELRTYFRATTATPRPLQTAAPQPAPAPAPWHRRPLQAAFGTVLAVAVAAAIAVPVVLNRASSGRAGSSGTLLVFMSEPAPSTNSTQIPFTQLPKYASTSCLFALETAPVSGGPLRSVGSVNLCNGNEQPAPRPPRATTSSTR